MIQIKQLTKNFGEFEALNGVDLDIKEGECVVLIGPSGCGKTTLLKSINRMIEPNGGEIIVDGRNINSYPPEELRRNIGYCIQNVGLFPHYSVHDNIAVVPKLLKWTKKDIDARVDFLMELTGLPHSYRDKKPHELSGGESQRVGVCRALAADPKILLMDEPFGAVDPMTRIKIQRAFRNIQKELKKTVVFVTHDVEEAILLADRIAVMQHGKILGYDTPEAFSHAMEVDFVQSFLGSDYPVKLLKRHLLDEMIPQDADSSQVTLNEILARLLQSPNGMISINDADGKEKPIRFEDLSRFLKETDSP